MNATRLTRMALFSSFLLAVLVFGNSPQAFALSRPNPIIRLAILGDGQAPAAVHVSATVGMVGFDPLCGAVRGAVKNLSYYESLDVSFFRLNNYTTAEWQLVADCTRVRDEQFRNSFKNELGGSEPQMTEFVWNFGDSSGRYNIVKGFNAAHIYDSAGTYTVRLMVTNSAGLSQQLEQVVHILPNTRPTLYVSTSGNDSNDGLSAATALRNPSTAGSRLINGTCGSRNILIKRGDRFVLPDEILLCKNTRVSTYGSGALPILSLNFPTQFPKGIFSKPWNQVGENIFIEDIVATSEPNMARPGVVPQNDFTGLVIRRVQHGRLWTPYVLSPFSRYILIQDNGAGPHADGTWPADDSVGNFTFVQAKNVAFYGNSFKLDLNTGEPLFRTCGSQVEMVAVVGNNFHSNVRNKDNPISIRTGALYSISKNKVYAGTINIGSGCAGGEINGFAPTERNDFTVFEENQFTNIEIVPMGGAKNVRIANNSFWMTSDSSGIRRPRTRFFGLADVGLGSNGRGFPPPESIAVIHNTFVNEATNVTLFEFNSTRAQSLDFVNNLTYSTPPNVPSNYVRIFAMENLTAATAFRPLRRADGNVFIHNDNGRGASAIVAYYPYPGQSTVGDIGNVLLPSGQPLRFTFGLVTTADNQMNITAGTTNLFRPGNRSIAAGASANLLLASSSASGSEPDNYAMFNDIEQNNRNTTAGHSSAGALLAQGEPQVPRFEGATGAGIPTPPPSPVTPANPTTPSTPPPTPAAPATPDQTVAATSTPEATDSGGMTTKMSCAFIAKSEQSSPQASDFAPILILVALAVMGAIRHRRLMQLTLR